ncbi:hypothetical protein BOTBODRAFT_272409 [Botryobasidium botryosum FD-172 SS1]|uniref:F-box domain-containing protein n=1 Tax=Botryobasidium botryosum (strain FD-172 SS1) TaxID=930990 RepID=A0A067M2A1_BOTB1|nr:hypothetical protein BOTBODRAFT_272409 [Botryobasidium botryosum FD-172 SS1]
MEAIVSNLAAQLTQVLEPQIQGGDNVIKFADVTYRLDDIDKIDGLCSKVELDLQEAKSALDAVINSVTTHIKKTLCDVRIHRNQLRPISRLSNELTANIFELVEKTPGNSTRALLARAPINLSQVSTLWRDIALNDPNLWTSINVLNVPLHRTFLPRSKGAPLDITLTPSRGMDLGDPCHGKIMNMFPYSIEPFTRYLDRWRTLQIYGLHFETLDYDAFTSPAPRLETLDVNVRWHINNRSAVESPIGPDSSRLFGGQTPRLRNLRLNGLCIPLTSPIYRSLTQLSLVNIDFVRSSMHDFVGILAACPLLSTLFLCGVELPGGGILSLSFTTPIHMHRLESIDLSRMSGNSMRQILAAVRVPASAKLQVTAGDGTDLRGLLPPVGSILDSFPFLPDIRHLDVYAAKVGCDMFGHGQSLNHLYLRANSFDDIDPTLAERVILSIG